VVVAGTRRLLWFLRHDSSRLDPGRLAGARVEGTEITVLRAE
jgi:hypothetical protein